MSLTEATVSDSVITSITGSVFSSLTDSTYSGFAFFLSAAASDITFAAVPATAAVPVIAAAATAAVSAALTAASAVTAASAALTAASVPPCTSSAVLLFLFLFLFFFFFLRPCFFAPCSGFAAGVCSVFSCEAVSSAGFSSAVFTLFSSAFSCFAFSPAAFSSALPSFISTARELPLGSLSESITILPSSPFLIPISNLSLFFFARKISPLSAAGSGCFAAVFVSWIFSSSISGSEISEKNSSISLSLSFSSTSAV